MSWFNSDYKYRAAISIDNHGGTNSIEVTVTIPTDWPQFWDVVLSSGNDAVVTLKDGVTVSTFKLSAWDYAANTGTIQIDTFAASTTAAALTCWLYWGKAGASSLQTAFSHTTTPRDGYIEVATPGTGSSPVVTCRPESPGATTPRSEIIHRGHIPMVGRIQGACTAPHTVQQQQSGREHRQRALSGTAGRQHSCRHV